MVGGDTRRPAVDEWLELLGVVKMDPLAPTAPSRPSGGRHQARALRRGRGLAGQAPRPAPRRPSRRRLSSRANRRSASQSCGLARDRQAAVGIIDGGRRQQRLSDVAVAARPRQPDVAGAERGRNISHSTAQTARIARRRLSGRLTATSSPSTEARRDATEERFVKGGVAARFGPCGPPRARRPRTASCRSRRSMVRLRLKSGVGTSAGTRAAAKLGSRRSLMPDIMLPCCLEHVHPSVR